MNIFISGIALVSAVIDWVAVANKWKKLEYFAKPGVILALISWLIVNGGYRGQLLFFLIGLIFSLAGDIFLMLPNEHFLAGLISFLLALTGLYPRFLYSFSKFFSRRADLNHCRGVDSIRGIPPNFKWSQISRSDEIAYPNINLLIRDRFNARFWSAHDERPEQ